MGLRFIRKPSETPDELNNVLNIDDIRMVRYAYGNQNGYIKGYGQELSHTIVGSTFMINSGIFVIQGAEIEIDANGWGESVSGVINKRYYTVYGEVNLALQIAEIKSKYHTANYPTIEASDDLTQSTNGTARVLLYRFTATNGIISDVQKVIKPIEYTQEVVDTLKSGIESGTVRAKIAEYASSNTSKGTIEQRLTNLGFKQGSVSFFGGGTTRLTRQGNYVVWAAYFNNASTTPLSGTLCTLPVNFRPATTITLILGGRGSYTYSGYSYSNRICICTMTINGNDAGSDAGKVILTTPIAQYGIHNNGSGILDINCAMNTANWQIGFEAPPIT